MFSNMDDYLIHQTEEPVAIAVSKDPHWDDSAYFFLHDDKGEIVVFLTYEIFPNKGDHGHTRTLMIACCRGQHYRYVFDEETNNDDRITMKSGAMEFSIIEPNKTWGIKINDEANQIFADLIFDARCPVNYVKPPFWMKSDNSKPVIHQQHYNQSGRFEGKLSIAGEAFSNLTGMRNRSWGVRAWLDLPMYHWCEAQFDTFAINTWKFENQDGSSVYTDGAITHEDGRIERIVRYDQRIETFDGTGIKRPRVRHCEAETEDGTVYKYTATTKHSMVLGPTPDQWSEHKEEDQANADEVALWYEQLVEVEFGEHKGHGMFEVYVSPGSEVHNIPPTPFPEWMLTTYED